MTFELHPQLEKDCLCVGELDLCRLLLMNDSHYPWCILVPRRSNKREIFELEEHDQLQLRRESIQLSQVMMKLFNGEKMNTAALGNLVPQLHIHHIVRYSTDSAWPGPVWGKVPPRPYGDNEARKTLSLVQQGMGLADSS